MFLTKIQKEILEMQKNANASRKVIQGQTESTIGRTITISQMHTTNTVVYKDIIEALKTLDNYYKLFERRSKRDHKIIKPLIKSINRKINKSLRGI